MQHLYPTILKDNNRLKEIYNLRVLAYEHSLKARYVNSGVFPHGWQDALDEKAIHWIVEDNGGIVASARLVILDNLDDTGEDLHMFGLPVERPFAYFSRLVVHPDFRGLGISKRMDTARMDYIKSNHIPFTLAFSFADRAFSLEELGFRPLGLVKYRWCGAPLEQIDQHLFIFRNNLHYT